MMTTQTLPDSIFLILGNLILSLRMEHFIVGFFFFLFIQTVLAVKHDRIFKRTVDALEQSLLEKVDMKIKKIVNEGKNMDVQIEEVEHKTEELKKEH